MQRTLLLRLTGMADHQLVVQTALSQILANLADHSTELAAIKAALNEPASDEISDVSSDESSSCESVDEEKEGHPFSWSAWPLYLDSDTADSIDEKVLSSMAQLPILKSLLRVPGAMVKANMTADKHSHLPGGTIAKMYGGRKQPQRALVLNSQALIEFLENLPEAVQPEVQAAVFLAQFGRIVGTTRSVEIRPEDGSVFHFSSSFALVPTSGTWRISVYTNPDNMAVASTNFKAKPGVFTGGMLKAGKTLENLTQNEADKLSGKYTWTAMTIPQQVKTTDNDSYDERVEQSEAPGTVVKPVLPCQTLRFMSRTTRDNVDTQLSEIPKDGSEKLIVTVSDSDGAAAAIPLAALIKCMNQIGCELTAQAKEEVEVRDVIQADRERFIEERAAAAADGMSMT